MSFKIHLGEVSDCKKKKKKIIVKDVVEDEEYSIRMKGVVGDGRTEVDFYP